MFRPLVSTNEVVSFAVMLLMVVALVAGQAEATVGAAPERQPIELKALELNAIESMTIEQMQILKDRMSTEFERDFEGDIAAVLKVSIDVASDLGHFRGEDE